MGTPCVEITRYDPHPNCTASVIVGITGVKYVKVVDGSSDGNEFLQFIGESVESYTDEGEPVFNMGDCLIVDNAPTHHNLSERVLQNWLPTVGLEYIFLPTYSPDLNPAEQCFRNVKTILKRPEYASVLYKNLKVSVYQAFAEVTANDTKHFFADTEYIQAP
jgi:transposase